MIRNEYGSVQQHLEAKHISGIVIPIPEDWQTVEPIVKAARNMVNAKEKIEQSMESMSTAMTQLLKQSIAQQIVPADAQKAAHR